MMKKMLIATALMMAVAGANAQNFTHGIDLKMMDPSVAPGDNFYEYAGGGWMKANPLSERPEYSSYGVFNVLAEENQYRLRDMFVELGKTDHPMGSVDQKVADLYKLAMDSDRLNREGALPIKEDLAKAQAFKKSNLTEEIANMALTCCDPFFSAGVSTDLKNSDMNVMWLSAGTGGLPDRDYYLNTDEKSRDIQEKYRDYLRKMFMLSGYTQKDAARAVKTIYDIEYRFAEAEMPRAEARDYTKLYNVRTIDQLQKDYPAINWRKYFTMLGVPDIDWVILTEPKVMAVANDMMKKLTEQQIRDYVSRLVITGASGALSDEFGETSFDFYGRVLSGQKERKPRWKRALGVPNGLLGEAVGEVYVSKYFAKGSKEKMLKLINNLRKSLAAHIAALTWMSDATKINALVKLNAFTVKVGYPDKWRDYSKLLVDPQKSLYENVKQASIYNTRRNLDKWNKPVDKDEWHMTPQTINAYYNPTSNEICFPAAILQPPFFDVDADDAVNYGAIGVVIGHEMTHGFDDQGRMFDQYGNMTDWWTQEDADRFKAATEKLAEQFNEVVVNKEQDLHANGELTLGENIADQGGLRVAYDAFRNTDQYREGKSIDGFTPTQRFYLSYGRIWAENNTTEAEFQQTKTDPHSLGKNRVNVTLRNIDTFFDAFDIKPGQPMWRDPAERVVIW